MSSEQNGIQITVVDVNTVPAVAGNTLLESLEANGINAAYHCRDGFCGACRCKLVNGEVEYTVDPLAFIDDDEILLCCCVPATNVSIKFE